MTDYLESDGWAYLYNGTDTLRAYCERIKVQPIHKDRVSHYEGGINIGIPIAKEYVLVTIEGVWINTKAKTENYILYMKTWLNAGTLKIRVQVNSSSAYLKLDGTNTVFPVTVKGGSLGNIEKMAKGDQTIFYIDKVILEQNGAGS